MTSDTFNPKLWTHRGVEDTKKIYAEWADSYDSDVTRMAYATPDRVAGALLEVGAETSSAVLDFGCGTGLSGLALRQHGFDNVDGTDISAEMIAHARKKTFKGAPIYRTLWLGIPGEVTTTPGDYEIIVATGVVSLGAAPPEMLETLLYALGSGGLLAFSYNDPTLDDPAYTAALDDLIASSAATQVFRAHGPHLSEKVTGSDVIILRRT